VKKKDFKIKADQASLQDSEFESSQLWWNRNKYPTSQNVQASSPGGHWIIRRRKGEKETNKYSPRLTYQEREVAQRLLLMYFNKFNKILEIT